MHMSNALVSIPVGSAMCAVSGGLFIYSLSRIKKEGTKKDILLMGMLGAFVFALQMLNFPIFAGVSGHIIGAVLLAALWGPYRAFVTMSIILLVQALFFADGGLLSLGCNIFNMAAIGCFIAYPLIYKSLAKYNIAAASLASCAVAIPLGALCIAFETLFSGTIPFTIFIAFASLLVPVHFAIGLAEGAATSVILLLAEHLKGRAMWAGAASFVIMGVLALFTSGAPDGLQWAINKTLTDMNSPNAISEIK